LNFFAPIMLARGLLELLKAAKGAVVNVSSIAGSGPPVRRGGLRHLQGGARLPDAGDGVRPRRGRRARQRDRARRNRHVDPVALHRQDTSILSPGTERIVAQIPLHRLGTPDEVAKIIYVLCTETSSYVNGTEIHISGGQHV
jgi:NAD(P)-dependent dehydrogenase (short-subunit alcohol dehydrogenase family)